MQYSIEGEPLPVVICNLAPGETMITEKGAMSWMSPNMRMESARCSEECFPVKVCLSMNIRLRTDRE